MAVLGAGYVGLITGACFAEFGHQVICVDTHQSKIHLLNQQIMPIYEPSLSELAARNVVKERLFFTADINNALARARLYLYCRWHTNEC